MSIKQRNFQEDFVMSQGVSSSNDIGDILLGVIPGALSVTPAHSVNDRNGTDWWVEHASGKHLSVDCKVRKDDWKAKNEKYDDLALETWSVCESKKPGWTRDGNKRTDYILWYWQDTRRWCLVPFAMLCRVFKKHWQQWREDYRTEPQNTEGRYHSECVFVPRRIVWGAIYHASEGHCEIVNT